MPRGTPKITFCKKPPAGIPNFEWRAAARGYSTRRLLFRSHARALAARFPHMYHVWITTDQLVIFYKNEFDVMRCKLDCIENLCLHEKYLTLP